MLCIEPWLCLMPVERALDPLRLVTEGLSLHVGAGNRTPVLCRSHGAPHHRVSTPALGLVLKDLLFSFVIYV